MNVISLGAGVQSSTMALMAAHREITPMPDCAIFADTQAEPRAVYEWLDWLEKRLPFPVYRVSAGSLEDAAITRETTGSGCGMVPFFVPGGMGKRQCTRHFKIDPIRKKIRELLGAKSGERIVGVKVTQWIGISLDEAHRMRTPREAWISHRYPLVDCGMSRWNCLGWMGNKNYPQPAKSACYFCPYHDDGLWRSMKLSQPDEFARAIKFERSIGVSGARLHRSLRWLDEVDFSNAEDFGQMSMFGNECEGMCGV